VDLQRLLVGAAVVLAILVVLYLFLPEPKRPPAADDGIVELEPDEADELEDEADEPARARRPVFAGGYPVPPMPDKSPSRPAAATTSEEPPGV
jgi:hypothetical protein